MKLRGLLVEFSPNTFFTELETLMQTNHLHLPDAPEALIEETREALFDLRVINAVVRCRPFEGDETYGHEYLLGGENEPREGENDMSFAQRAWRGLLPGDDSSDFLKVRTLFGWSYKEAQHVRMTLGQVADEFIRLYEAEGILSGTRETLLRDLDKVIALAKKWDWSWVKTPEAPYSIRAALSPNVRHYLQNWTPGMRLSTIGLTGNDDLDEFPMWALHAAAGITEQTVPQVSQEDTRNMLYEMPAGLKLHLTEEIVQALVEAARRSKVVG